MSKRLPSKDEALEALDFIVNVLKEHEKDLDRLISELGNVAEKLESSGELNNKMDLVGNKISGLQREIGNLLNYLSSAQRPTSGIVAPVSSAEQLNSGGALPTMNGPPLILRCKQWEDFETLANQANTLSFLVKEPDKTIQVDAAKNNQIISYNGEMPNLSLLIRAWLSKRMEVSDKKVIEGVLAIG